MRTAIRSFALAAFLAAILPGCVVAPAPGPVAVAPAPPAEEFDYVGETTPIAIAAYPQVIFYPRYLPYCNCIRPVGYYNGVWIDHGGATVVYEGAWRHPPEVVIVKHREYMHAHPEYYRRMSHEHWREVQARHPHPSYPTARVAPAQPPHAAPAATHAPSAAPAAAPGTPTSAPSAQPGKDAKAPGSKQQPRTAGVKPAKPASGNAAPKPAPKSQQAKPAPKPKKSCPDGKKDC